jgi:hypothetical protein
MAANKFQMYEIPFSGQNLPRFNIVSYCAESTPGPQYGRKDYVNKHFNDTIGNQTRDFPACFAVPQTTAPPRAPLKNRIK